MDPILVNFIFIIYIISPVIVIVLFGILIFYEGRIAEEVGVGIFIIMLFGHITALIITVRTRKRLKWKYVCADVIVFISQLILTVIGVMTGVENASNRHFSCFSKKKSISYRYVSFTITTTPIYSTETTDVCGLPIGLFTGALAILIVRCWILPIMERYRKARRKKRNVQNNIRVRISRNRNDREPNLRDRGANRESQRCPEIDLSPPPLFWISVSYPLLPSYDSISNLDNCPPPPYLP